MSAFQFDDLLGDFDESTMMTTTTTTTNSSSHDLFDDDFDPLGPSSGGDHTSSGGNFGLLLDFSPNGEIKNVESRDGSSSHFESYTSTSSSNPFHAMSTEAEPSNPLYDLTSDNANPLYDLTTDGSNTNQSPHTIYEYRTTTTTSSSTHKSSPSSNPLYDDFDNDQSTNEAAEEEDLLSGTNEEQQQQQEEEEGAESLHSSHSNNDFDERHPDLEFHQQHVETAETTPREVHCYEDIHDVETVHAQRRQQHDDDDDDDDNDYHGHVEVVEEKQEVVEDGRTITRITRTETRRSGSEAGNTRYSDDFSNKNWEEEKNRQNADLNRHSREQDHVNVYDVSYTKSEPTPAPRRQVEVHKEETRTYESHAQSYQPQDDDDDEEEGVFENKPTRRDDVTREADTDKTADLPAQGTAQSMRARYLSASQDSTTSATKHEVSSSDFDAGGEYVSEPRSHIEKYEGRPESGVFESQPVAHHDVVTSSSVLEEATYESGFAKNTAAKFREMERKSSTSKEASHDHDEHVPQPRGYSEIYESKAESGVFESEPVLNLDVVRSGELLQDQLPEKGMARNLASRFIQIGEENRSSSSAGGSRNKRESYTEYSSATQVEYVSEPSSHVTNDYVAKVDAGVFENQPQRHADVVTSDSVTEEYVPERGFARNVAARFKEMESTAKSPPLSPGRRKEFTPPREDDRYHQSAVAENKPDFKPDVVHSDDHLEEVLPEIGMAKNLAQRFRQMEVENKNQSSSSRSHKEFTPPPARDAGVYENQPKQFHPDYNKPAESGVIENEPVRREDVIRGDEPPRYEEELPERGAAKNLVNKWRQMEIQGAKLKSPGSSGRPKEFTPPREEPRLSHQRKSPKSPLSPTGHGRLDNGSVHPNDLPGQYQPQDEASVSESTPQQQRSDIAREGDTDWSDGMPKKDTAKKMLARFQSMEIETKQSQQQPAPTSRRDSETSDPDIYETMENTIQNTIEDENKVGRSKSMRAAVQTEKCGACEKTVYAMERLEMNKRVYHKACFRCTQCKTVLTPKTFAINNEVIFCTTHYKQLFATKGNYDEGFGRTQHKKRWNSNPNLAKDEEEDGQS